VSPLDAFSSLAHYNGYMRVLTGKELVMKLESYSLPPTFDDVSITKDGRRLDTKEKVLEFLAEIESACKQELQRDAT
jgi:hypothetical protein